MKWFIMKAVTQSTAEMINVLFANKMSDFFDCTVFFGLSDFFGGGVQPRRHSSSVWKSAIDDVSRSYSVKCR